MNGLKTKHDKVELPYSELKGFQLIRSEGSVSEKELKAFRDAKLNDIQKNNDKIPKKDGRWDGEVGNSLWIPDSTKVPENKQVNPEGKNWGDIKAQYGINGIPFEKNEPNFKEVSQGTVRIDRFTSDRAKNYSQADLKLAHSRGEHPSQIRKFRIANQLTWHERKDRCNMDLVPSIIHGSIPHSGGISAQKRLEKGIGD